MIFTIDTHFIKTLHRPLIQLYPKNLFTIFVLTFFFFYLLTIYLFYIYTITEHILLGILRQKYYPENESIICITILQNKE